MRLLRPVDLSALPLLIMEHERLIERTAEAMGLGQVAVSWQRPRQNRDRLDALAAGQADFAAAELVPFLRRGAIADRPAARRRSARSAPSRSVPMCW